jgi:hypothetical protein
VSSLFVSPLTLENTTRHITPSRGLSDVLADHEGTLGRVPVWIVAAVTLSCVIVWALSVTWVSIITRGLLKAVKAMLGGEARADKQE